MHFWTVLTLAILAGAFIALGAIFATTVAAGLSGVVPYGIARLLIGLVFSLGLILVVVGGAELFTGNNLIVMAWAGGKVSTMALLRNWGIVYLGNLIGSLGTALMMFMSKQYIVRQRRGRHRGAEHRQQQGAPGVRAGRVSGDHVQRAGLPGGVDDLQRPQHGRQDHGHRVSRSRPSSPAGSSTASPTCTSSPSGC